jgi:hypothetical protein
VPSTFFLSHPFKEVGIVFPHSELHHGEPYLDSLRRDEKDTEPVLMDSHNEILERKWIQDSNKRFARLIEKWWKDFLGKYPTAEMQEKYYYELAEEQKGKGLPLGFVRKPSSMLSEECCVALGDSLGLYTVEPLEEGKLVGLYFGVKWRLEKWQKKVNRWKQEIEECELRGQRVCAKALKQKLRDAQSYAFDLELPDKKSKNTSYVVHASDEKNSGFIRRVNTPFVGERRFYENTRFYSFQMGRIPVIGLFTLKSIPANTELCASYGPKYSISRWDVVQKMPLTTTMGRKRKSTETEETSECLRVNRTFKIRKSIVY